MKSVRLRGLTPDDSPLLLAWRNDPETCRNSLQAREVVLADHLAWFERMLEAGPDRIQVGELDGVPVGVVRLDWDEEHEACDLSFTVAPEHRGKGIGTAMVAAALDPLHQVRVAAEVKISNAASRKIFESLQFRLIDSQGELLMYAKDVA